MNNDIKRFDIEVGGCPCELCGLYVEQSPNKYGHFISVSDALESMNTNIYDLDGEDAYNLNPLRGDFVATWNYEDINEGCFDYDFSGEYLKYHEFLKWAKDTKIGLRKENQDLKDIFHYINTCVVSCDNDKISEVIQAISDWSYAHRQGNGELSDYEVMKNIDAYFGKLKNIAGIV